MSLSEEITMRILGVLKRSTAISDEMLEPLNWGLPLTGHYYKLSATDLVYLLFELEAEFNIRIPPQMLDDYRFSTIQGICEIIQKRL